MKNLLKYSRLISLFIILSVKVECTAQLSCKFSITADYRISKNNMYEYLNYDYVSSKDRITFGFNSNIQYKTKVKRLPLVFGIGVDKWVKSSQRTIMKTGNPAWVVDDWELTRRYYQCNYLSKLQIGTHYRLRSFEAVMLFSFLHSFGYSSNVKWREPKSLTFQKTQTFLNTSGFRNNYFIGYETNLYWPSIIRRGYDNNGLRLFSGFGLYFTNASTHNLSRYCIPYFVELIGLEKKL